MMPGCTNTPGTASRDAGQPERNQAQTAPGWCVLPYQHLWRSRWTWESMSIVTCHFPNRNLFSVRSYYAHREVVELTRTLCTDQLTSSGHRTQVPLTPKARRDALSTGTTPSISHLIAGITSNLLQNPPWLKQKPLFEANAA